MTIVTGIQVILRVLEAVVMTLLKRGIYELLYSDDFRWLKTHTSFHKIIGFGVQNLLGDTHTDRASSSQKLSLFSSK
jgi:hypothetical protein